MEEGTACTGPTFQNAQVARREDLYGLNMLVICHTLIG